MPDLQSAWRSLRSAPLLARAAARRYETGVLMALGASRWKLVRQRLTESLLTAGAGGPLGCLAAALGSRLLISQMTDSHLDLSLDMRLAPERVVRFHGGCDPRGYV